MTFSGGDCFNFKPTDKVILVGPNNSGKSQTLREIINIADKGDEANKMVIQTMDISKKGSQKDIEAFLKKEGRKVEDRYHDEAYQYKDWITNLRDLSKWEDPYLTKGLARGFIKNIEVTDRLEILAYQDSYNNEKIKFGPRSVLYEHPELMEEINDFFHEAFGQNIMFDYRGGYLLPIHVGDFPDMREAIDRIGNEYVKAVRDNPLLDEQGDGVKSYAGLLFEVIVFDRDMILIDEPEAFLHPPQMRQLGEMLAAKVRGQLFIATHSSDIVRGLLEGKQGNVRILRIHREANKNIVTEADPEVIRMLWEKPILRYSNALEGLFHEQVIICEDDSDCRLVNSVGDHVSSKYDQWKDTAYIPAGGKHQIPKIASVLRPIGVPLKAIFDIDFLAEENLVKETVEAFGGNWKQVSIIWNRIDKAVRGGITPKTPVQIKTEICDFLNRADGDSLPKSEIIEMLKQDKSWNKVKRHGTNTGFPKGDAQKYYYEIEEILEEIGIYLVSVGELENFCTKIGSSGPNFVTKLLSESLLDDRELTDLLAFVERVHIGHLND